ncbi:MAG: hypothetical protein C0591_13870 [Marinilabiliales bacterium]|nr:MAG: hypothetical protein C0591_13870 [Marinilabiliales bacterium]
MKNCPFKVILLLLIIVACLNVRAEQIDNSTIFKIKDTVKDKETKKLLRQEERIQLRQSHNRFGLKFSYVYAFLDTEVSFELPQGNLNSTLSLEQNLGLPKNSYFFTGSFLYRITPRSGIYAQYYGINRSENSQTDRQFIFKNDTIPAGTDIEVYFNTQVISAGYLLSVLRDPNAFLGFYFNIYFMILETGVKSDQGSINSNVELIAPLPNFGIVASFKLNKWLYLDGEIGFFSLHTSTFGGSLHNFNLSLMARPIRWLGINLSYQEFDVRMEFPSEDINTVVDYNFRGPAIGLSFFF